MPTIRLAVTLLALLGWWLLRLALNDALAPFGFSVLLTGLVPVFLCFRHPPSSAVALAFLTGLFDSVGTGDLRLGDAIFLGSTVAFLAPFQEGSVRLSAGRLAGIAAVVEVAGWLFRLWLDPVSGWHPWQLALPVTSAGLTFLAAWLLFSLLPRGYDETQFA